MSSEGGEKLGEEMSSGRENIKTFGEKMKAEFAGVKMVDRVADAGETPEGASGTVSEGTPEGKPDAIPGPNQEQQEEGEE